MAYVPNFKYDIFISYAHADDEADPMGVQWVSEFQVFLKKLVRRHLGGQDPNVFFDELELHPHHLVESALTSARESAIFVPILSTSYVERIWTNAELRAFSAQAIDESRVFAVELLQPLGGYPEEIEKLKRKQFWYEDQKGVAPKIITPKNRPDIFTDYLTDLAFLIAKRLRDMRSQVEPATNGMRGISTPAEPHTLAPSQPGKGSDISGKTVLLAEVTDDLRPEHLQVRKYLEQYRINVLPKLDYPENSAKFIEAFTADIKDADLVIQLLSGVRTEKLEGLVENGETISAGKFQFNAAKHAGKPLMQWLHPTVKPQTVTHRDRALIDGSLEGNQIAATGLEEFKRAIKVKLEALSKVAEPEPIPPPGHSRKPYIFITAGFEDKRRANELYQRFSKEDCIASILPFDEKSQAKRQIFNDKIRRADAVVFFYGEVTSEFIGQWLDEYVNQETPGQRLEVVYYAPPEDKPEIPVNWRELEPFGSRKDFILDDVQKILAKLRHEAR